MRTHFLRVLALFSAGALLLGAGVALAATFTVRSASTTALGKVAVNSKGFTLYHNTREVNGKIVCTGACATTWPPLLTTKTAKLKAGPAVKASKLGRIKRPDGHFQVTYFGFPLYRYAGDSAAGQTAGEGIGGIWFAVKPSGALAKPPAAPMTTTTTTTTTTPGTTTTTPYGY